MTQREPMNLFKVIASGRKKFQEETASALLAWFLNPSMEHGLGFEFLSRFLTGLQESTNNTDLSGIINNLTPKLRSEADDQTLNFWCSLEMPVPGAVIDVVLGLDNWVFAIENKIYSTSATDHQLIREYKGIKEKLPENRIGMIYLVPVDAPDSPLDTKVQAIYDELEPDAGDLKALVTWQDNNLENAPSIASIIRSILDDESQGDIEPVPEYCRHTLKALLIFIKNDFAGYDYDKVSSHSGQNPLTEEHLTVEQLKSKQAGFVGTSGGVRGLIRIGKDGIISRKFQYSTSDMTHSRNWVPLEMFNGVTDWLVDGLVGNIKWTGKFPSEMIYQIAQDYEIYVGIRGGERAFRDMSLEVMQSKEWAITTENEGKNSQWIEGKVYCQIMEGKL